MKKNKKIEENKVNAIFRFFIGLIMLLITSVIGFNYGVNFLLVFIILISLYLIFSGAIKGLNTIFSE